MSTMIVAGHTLEFTCCREVGQGGPVTCAMAVDDVSVTGRGLFGRIDSLRFHPTPLAFEGALLLPLWQSTKFYLVRIDPFTLKIKKLSRGFSYMRLLGVIGNEVELSIWHDDRDTRKIRVI